MVITGGTSGIGYELVKMLHAHNSLSVIARASNRLQALREEFPDIKIYEADLSDTQAVKHAAFDILATGQPVDVLINNAAVQYTPFFGADEFDIDSIETEINTNLTTPALLIASLLPALEKSSSL